MLADCRLSGLIVYLSTVINEVKTLILSLIINCTYTNDDLISLVIWSHCPYGSSTID